MKNTQALNNMAKITVIKSFMTTSTRRKVYKTFRVGSSLACKYQTRVEVNGSEKHSSLLLYDKNYSHKKFYGTTSWGKGYKTLRVGSSLACKYQVRVELNGSENILAYFNMAKITFIKSFMVQAPGEKVIKLSG